MTAKRTAYFVGAKLYLANSVWITMFVRTETFVGKILLNHKALNDDWEFIVRGQVEYVG